MYSPFIFVKTFADLLAYYGVDVSDDVITHKAIRCANGKIFWCFDISEPTSDLLQNDLQRKSSLIIITDVNKTSKRAFL